MRTMNRTAAATMFVGMLGVVLTSCAMEVGDEEAWVGASSVALTATTAAQLVSALAETQPGDVVDIPEGVEIDLSNRWNITIPAGVTLRGTRSKLQKGALLYTRTFADEKLFVMGGNGARITGLRIRGPSGSDTREQETAGGITVATHLSVSIDNNELFNWPYAAVEVYGTQGGDLCGNPGSGRLPTVRIRRNYIHHNQRNGLGYGVVVMRGGFPRIDENTFDSNRHAIAADGRTLTSYFAYHNLVLEGGVQYCNEESGGCYWSHHFDMHGRDEDYKGGNAGELVDIGWNTFRGEQDYGDKTRAAYYLRGDPCGPNTFHHNVLMHEQDEAVRTEGSASDVEREANLYNVGTVDNLAVGDFDGDGRDDLFMATGAAWYYSSAGQTDWRFLASSEVPMSALRFGDFDGDGRADVFTSIGGEWRISRSGTSAWSKINTSNAALELLRFGDFNGDGRTDVFKASGSAWAVSYSGTGSWTELATSTLGVDGMRFGDFNGDGRTDVFSLASGQWSVSYGGTSTWSRLNALLDQSLTSLVFADFDGNGRTDIARSVVLLGIGDTQIEWRVSWNGSGAWTRLRLLPPDGYLALSQHFVGRFDTANGADAVRYSGRSFVRSSGAKQAYVTHSLHAMR